MCQTASLHAVHHNLAEYSSIGTKETCCIGNPAPWAAHPAIPLSMDHVSVCRQSDAVSSSPCSPRSTTIQQPDTDDRLMRLRLNSLQNGTTTTTISAVVKAHTSPLVLASMHCHLKKYLPSHGHGTGHNSAADQVRCNFSSCRTLSWTVTVCPLRPCGLAMCRLLLPLHPIINCFHTEDSRAALPRCDAHCILQLLLGLSYCPLLC